MGCSGTGGYFCDEVARSPGDLIHGNGQTRNADSLIQKCRDANPDAPVVVNRDRRTSRRFPYARARTSPGATTQPDQLEPSARWGSFRARSFFALRMARQWALPCARFFEKQFALLGMEPKSLCFRRGQSPWRQGSRASTLPALARGHALGAPWRAVSRAVDYVEFFVDGS